MQFVPQSIHMKQRGVTELLDPDVKQLLAHDDGQQKKIKNAFFAYVERMRSNEILSLFDSAYRRGSLMEIVGLGDKPIEDMAAVLDDVFVSSGEFENRRLVKELDIRYAKTTYVDPSVDIGFNPGEAEAAALLRQSKLEFIRELKKAEREAIRRAMSRALSEGMGAAQAARLFQNSIGLTDFQNGIVDSFERQLRSLDPESLTRVLRDRRFDRTISRAIRDAERLTEKQITTMVDRYRSRMIAMRAETIARTEGLSTVNRARHAALSQVAATADIKMENIVRVWRATIDGRTRDTHRAMSGQKRGAKEKFRSPSGAKLLHPGDRSAPAAEVINCRCVLQVKFVQPKQTKPISTAPKPVKPTPTIGGPAEVSTTRPQIDFDIGTAYRTIRSKNPSEHWVYLEDLRLELPAYSREEVDDALKRLWVEGASKEKRAIDLSIQDDQGLLTPGRRNAATRFGGSRQDIIFIRNDSPVFGTPPLLPSGFTHEQQIFRAAWSDTAEALELMLKDDLASGLKWFKEGAEKVAFDGVIAESRAVIDAIDAGNRAQVVNSLARALRFSDELEALRPEAKARLFTQWIRSAAKKHNVTVVDIEEALLSHPTLPYSIPETPKPVPVGSGLSDDAFKNVIDKKKAKELLDNGFSSPISDARQAVIQAAQNTTKNKREPTQKGFKFQRQSRK